MLYVVPVACQCALWCHGICPVGCTAITTLYTYNYLISQGNSHTLALLSSWICCPMFLDDHSFQGSEQVLTSSASFVVSSLFNASVRVQVIGLYLMPLSPSL